MPVAIGNRPPRSILLPVMGGMVLLAWFALWQLDQSNGVLLLQHHHGGGGHARDSDAPAWLEATAYVAGWLLMTIAMMLPTTVPLAKLFQRVAARQRYPGLLMSLLLAGYLSAWMAFGIIALAAAWAIEQLRVIAAPDAAWLTGSGLFIIAGAFQFSRLKYACLERCRTPTGFLASHWHGRNAWSESFNVGWQHGVFCVGCCWALMLLMFAVSAAAVAWMLVLAIVMAVEKNLPWGRHLGRPLGALLLAVGTALTLYNIPG